MEIGIGLPSTIRGVTGSELLEWARRADAAGFSTLGTIDRIVYGNYESMTALTAAAAVTERIRLTTGILLLPSRASAAVIAKEAATIQHLSGGRLVLGVAVGGREDDFAAAGVPFHERGKLMDRMLDDITRIWAGEERGFAGGIGPDVSDDPPRLILGGQADVAFRRAARYGDGWINGGGPPDGLPAAREKLEAAFREAGREERPRLLSLAYYSLEDDPEQAARSSFGDYYAFAPQYAEQVVAGVAKGADALRERVRLYAEAGCDELILFPSSTDPAQVDEVAAAVL